VTRYQDAIWTIDENGRLVAYGWPGGTCGSSVGDPVAFPAACPAGYPTNPNGTPLDTDGDGLLDCWEELGIDYDGDGIVDYVLPNANKNIRNIYLEIDYMSGLQPAAAAIANVVNAFANAPNGPIILTVQVDESFPFAFQLAFEPCTGPPPTGAPTFDGRKTASFGTAAERAATPS